MIWVFVGLVGFVLGSFLNVVIYRIPRGESIVHPPSHCPGCGRRIRFYDNIPVLSWFLLGGRCRDCRKPISPRYPIVEALTGLLFLAAYARFGPTLLTLKAMVFICLLVAMSFIDLDRQVIPYRLSIPGLALGLLAAPLLHSDVTLPNALAGAAVGAAFVVFSWALWRYVLARFFSRLGIHQKEGMGWGDLPLAAMIGAFVGPEAIAAVLFSAVVAGVIAGYISRAVGRTRRGQPMPFGPLLALGGLVGLFYGRELFGLYVAWALH